MKENDQEYIDWMKEFTKGFVEGIDTSTKTGRQALKMTYGFARECFLQSKAATVVK